MKKYFLKVNINGFSDEYEDYLFDNTNDILSDFLSYSEFEEYIPYENNLRTIIDEKKMTIIISDNNCQGINFNPQQEKKKIFISYSHKDKDMKEELENHLKTLERLNLLSIIWSDFHIEAGDEFSKKIDENIEDSDIVLLLVTHSFIASNYCYDIEMKRALEKHEKNELRVIPIILDYCDWHDLPFGKLKVLPIDGIAVTGYSNKNKAYTEVINGIKKVLI